MLQLDSWISAASTQLQESGSESPRLDAQLLACHVLKRTRTWLFTYPEHRLNTTELEQLDALLAQRLRGHPLAHLLGEREFWGLTLKVDNSTLIPRPDTETLVEWALELPLPATAQVLDLGTGTGAIALALASEQPSWRIQGVDLNPAAVALASTNAQLNQQTRVRFYQSSWFQQVHERFDLIVSNPPYIDPQDPHLSRGDVRFEPLTALIAAEQGLADIRQIIQCSVNFLQPQGWLLLEHGYQQAEQVQQLLHAQGFTQVSSRQDLAGQPRVTAGCWQGPLFAC